MGSSGQEETELHAAKNVTAPKSRSENGSIRPCIRLSRQRQPEVFRHGCTARYKSVENEFNGCNEMLGWLNHLRERWDNWSGDRDMEMAIRKHLNQEGYFGGTAKVQRLRLVAVQRPGWLQIYRFEAVARVRVAIDENRPDPDAEYRTLFGLVRDDFRHNVNDIRVFDDECERRNLFVRWSEGLHCLRGAYGLTQ
jgi:hypothetical protein